MHSDAARITAGILLETESVLMRPDNPFTLTSGRKSPVYVDCRRLIAFPRARRRLMAMAAALIEERIGFEALDVVAGGETAGIPFAAWIADLMMLPMCYVRKQAKGFGRNARIEGDLAPGQRAILVEDLATDGGSKLDFIEALREAEADCAHAFVIFHYDIFPAGIEKLRKAGVALHALATWWDVIALAESEGALDRDGLKTVRAFLEDPEGWAPAA
ncbi:MAG: orotate phosphoribosyltransferase [Rhodospirillales bacterium]|nr:MAG: orotate phosphoribosyltransferase [Rhodospirillales bacterium]